MARGSCTICNKKDSVTRKVDIASKVKENACFDCSNAIIVFVEVMKKKKVKA